MTGTELKRIKAICEIAHVDDIGDLSDGYHTFNQLYHQRAILFAALVNQNKSISWKSFKHEDGKYCFDRNGEWFIVGIDTPEGSYTYHYSKEYWDMFKCQELECGKHWDGHTEEDVTRLLSLDSMYDIEHFIQSNVTDDDPIYRVMKKMWGEKDAKETYVKIMVNGEVSE